MDRLSDKMANNHAAASSSQSTARTARRMIRGNGSSAATMPASDDLTGDRRDDSHSELPVIYSTQSDAAPIHGAATLSPLDAPTQQFSEALERRKENRQLLMEWLRVALVDGVDFGRVHVVSKDKCEHARGGRVKECANSWHWSKPSLFKPGAEKIAGMLGLTVHYPSLPAYESALLSGVDLRTVILRCELHDAHGRVVAEGVGARNLAADYGDINKALKMAEKSGQIDATLRLAALSEVFTQDMEDRPPEDMGIDVPPAQRAPAPKGRTASRQTQDIPSGPMRSTGHGDNGFSQPAMSPQGLGHTTPDQPADYETEVIGPEDVVGVRERIVEIGISEKRVLAWLYKVTKGTVTRFDQLNVAQCTSLLKRLDLWAREVEGDNAA